jgi:phenylalanyl-tRNA synthetase alpha chain
MTLDEFKAEAREIGDVARALLGAADPAERLDVVKGRLNAAINDRVTALQRALGALPPADRREAGQLFNGLKTGAIEPALADFQSRQAAARQTGERVDLTMPARAQWRGAKHPVTLVTEEIVAIFRELGFTVAGGPEAEQRWYNFDSLNFPPDHPAIEAHDTLYLAGSEDGPGAALLRTHTSPVQVRTLQRYRPPVRVLIPGMVYRRDFFDASHAPAFAQIEGLAVDEGISFVDLKATLSEFARRFFGAAKTRFRPSFFPFTEPSAEMDIECQLCKGSGCPGCKHTGWMEILGSGLVHPAVIEAAGLDSERYTGWAFGMGPGRIAMQRFNLPDIRLLYDSDMRFLEQFTVALGGAEG